MAIKRRAFAALVSLLYLSVAVVLGVMHDHHDHDHDHSHGPVAGHADDCAACQWQSRAVTDAPVVANISFDVPVGVRPVLSPATVTPESPFFFSTASRAPPELV